MLRHLIAFDLDETLSATHIFQAVVNQINVYQQDIQRLNRQRKRLDAIVVNPQDNLRQMMDAKLGAIKNNQARIKACQTSIIHEKQYSHSSDNTSLQLGDSDDECGHVLLSSSVDMIAAWEAQISNYERENVELQKELDAMQSDQGIAMQECVDLAKAKIIELDEANKKLAELYAAAAENVEAQWEVIKNISLMCDQPLLCDLILALQAEGHKIAIVTFNSFNKLVEKFVDNKCGVDTKSLIIDCLNFETSRERIEIGKNQHLARVIEQCEPEMCAELKNNLDRVLLIDDSAANVMRAKEKGHSAFHFDVQAMKAQSAEVAVNACNAYLAFLIIKFGYEEKLSAHIARLKLGPMLDCIKLQLEKESLQSTACLQEKSRKALHQSGLLVSNDRLGSYEEPNDIRNSSKNNKY